MAEENNNTISLESIASNFDLEKICIPENIADIKITRSDVSRPGLQLMGFFSCFEPTRIQIIGNAEHSYLSSLDKDVLYECVNEFVSKNPVAVVFTAGLEVFDCFIEAAKKYGVPVYRTKEDTSHFMAALIAYLNLKLAPSITRHGVLVEVYGEGILILGDSGIGKSETAIELVKRGHRLIADDAVEIRRVSATTLVGNAPEIIRHYIELRGIGVIDVSKIFGISAVKDTENIKLVIKLENWVQGKMYDRLGIESEYTDIMGIQVPTNTIPVKPGRNLAVIIEIAAMNSRLKSMGYNTAEEFNKKMLSQINFPQ
ncbi:MAG: HPr(Ser) kinase/phosphatase [Clostridia bacterium]|nr:HPr(Ser) kinase/phosphatase [Clostridia bacterium]